MSTRAKSIENFVVSIEERLEKTDSVRHKFDSMLRLCGFTNRSSSRVKAIADALRAASIYTDVDLVEDRPRNSQLIRFTRHRPDIQPGLTMPSEHCLRDFLQDNFKALKEFSGFSRAQREVPLRRGIRPDLLFYSGKRILVVELKVWRPKREVVSQLFEYMESLQDEKPTSQIEGLIITGHPNRQLEDHARILSERKGFLVRWLCYGMSIQFQSVLSTSGDNSAPA